MPRCAISIDVDPLACYYRIHGLGTPPEPVRDVIMERCVPRFAELFDRRGIRATFFIVASDMDEQVMGERAERARQTVRELSERGHEIGNHTYSHPYDLARLPQAAVVDEIERAHGLLSRAGQCTVTGHRAPGYDISATMLSELCRLGYTYDSSIFPAPGYYAAKAVIMAGLSLLGKDSGAVLTNPRALVSPVDAYRPAMAAPWRRGRAPLVELPISVTRWARIPVIGTSLVLAPGPVRARLIAAMKPRSLFNFELHGIDLADARADRIPAELVARQPDLRLPLDEKKRRFESMLDRIENAFALTRLDEYAAHMQDAV